MTNEVAVQNQQTNLMVAPTVAQDVDMLSTNILLPRILLMQGQSDFVLERKAQLGEFRKSTNCEKVGDPETPFWYIPVTFKNYWEEMEIIGEQKVYKGKIDRNAKNENDPWDFERNGAKMKRVQTIEVYGILPSEIQNEIDALADYKKTGNLPDLDKTILPCVITFRGTSFRAGKMLVNHWLKISKFPGVKAHHYMLNLSCEQDKNDKGTFFIWKTNNTKVIQKEYVEISDRWYNTLMSRPETIKVDDSVNEFVETHEDLSTQF